MEKIYSKQNSFVKIQTWLKESSETILKKIKLVLNEKNLSKLRKNHKSIINFVKKDLFKNGTKGRPRFQLSPNVIKEIQLLNDDEIARYLVHRYRYEIFPQINMLDDYPPYLQIEPTSICNYRCVFCFQTNNYFNKRSNGFMGRMTLKTFKTVIDQAENNIEFISLASRGEPLTCPNIVEMLEYTRNKFLNLKINTNASVLTERIAHAILQNGIRTLVFSADAADDKLYSKLRVNGKLSKVLSNVKLFKKVRDLHYSKAKIITRVSGVKVSSEQNFEEMENFWGDFVDQVAFVDYCPWENIYVQKINSLKTPCSELWRRMYVWWDGKVNPCEADYQSHLTTGFLKDGSLSDHWKSSQYQKIREAHIKLKRKNIDPCTRCTVI